LANTKWIATVKLVVLVLLLVALVVLLVVVIVVVPVVIVVVIVVLSLFSLRFRTTKILVMVETSMGMKQLSRQTKTRSPLINL